MNPLETREFKNVHVSWITLVEKLKGAEVVFTYSIEKVYPETNTIDILCYILPDKVEQFDCLCCYDGGK